jgi:hypothetical protein
MGFEDSAKNCNILERLVHLLLFRKGSRARRREEKAKWCKWEDNIESGSIQQRQENFLHFAASSAVPGLTQPPTKCIPGTLTFVALSPQANYTDRATAGDISTNF